MRLELFVPGIPQPQGSKDYVGHRKGVPILIESNARTLGPWREKIKLMVRAAMHDTLPMGGALQLESVFYLPRPQGHYGTGRNANILKGSAPAYPDVQPDLDKMLRALCDAIEQGAGVENDSRIVCHLTTKLYHDRTGVQIVLQPYPAAFTYFSAAQQEMAI